MTLTGQQLKGLYQALVLPMGHPDPIGYMTRAFLLTGGDPDYVGGDGKIGFMPVEPQRAIEMTGNSDVTTLENNIATTIIMDLMYYQQYRTVDDMVIAFHFGEEAISVDGSYTGAFREFLDSVEELRPVVKDIIDPPRATLKDVIKMLKDQLSGSNKPSKAMMELVERILEER